MYNCSQTKMKIIMKIIIYLNSRYIKYITYYNTIQVKKRVHINMNPSFLNQL